MESTMTFEITQHDFCCSTVAKLIQSSADAWRVVDLVQERCANSSVELKLAIDKLENLMSCWDAQEPEGEPIHDPSYGLAVALECDNVRRKLYEQHYFWVDQYKTEFLLDALAQAAIERFGKSLSTNPAREENVS